MPNSNSSASRISLTTDDTRRQSGELRQESDTNGQVIVEANEVPDDHQWQVTPVPATDASRLRDVHLWYGAFATRIDGTKGLWTN